ncbi:DUF4167 domain-containing protein [Brevundimonas sp.]|jgi:hypothetical protein|uniref:DUF4167 domain-containing protein n=1 Tax=Brevundimonas sp. TaxID=1871086 RepID=UPI0037C10089
MRDFKGMKRQRGRNRNKAGANNANNANPNRSWDSQGPENIKVRGNAQTVYERYQQLARDASSGGDRVLAENYQQHAEHYYRVLRALQPQRSFSDIAARELSNQGFDIDFEDESGAQAAAFVAAQQAADRQAQEASERADQGQNRDQNRDQNQNRDRDYNRDRDQSQNRDRDRDRDRDQNRDQNRDAQPPREDGEVRAEGEGGGRRESRRERWERRREERNRRFDGQENAGSEDAADAVQAEAAPVERVAETPVEAPAAEERPRRPRRTAAAKTEGDDEAPTALPGFLTRSSAPAPAAETTEDGEPAPRRRAPRRKAEAAADSEG